ncbi:hypothetical protein ACROYT_G029060 [Oculina patagonica]
MISNKRRTLKRFSAVILIFMFTTSALLTVHENQFQRNVAGVASGPIEDVVESTNKSKVSPPFIYLTQTEQCLPPYLIQTLELEHSSKCRCDVIVLSFKTECQENSGPHITYMFDNKTSWGSGRNKLFVHAEERRLDYIYYIFLDDDIALKFNDAATPEMRRLPPIHVFQNWLLEYEPALGVVDYEVHDGKRMLLSRRRMVCDNKLVNNTSHANPTILYDPLLNAFHAKAVGHIFPLDSRYENVNWWLTDKYLASVVELKFRGQALLFFPVTVENLLHRPYPQSSRGTISAWRGFIKDIHKQVPVEYEKHTLFKKFYSNPRRYVARSWTYCMSITRKQDIKPFAHFARESKILKY